MAGCKYCEHGERNEYLIANRKFLGTLSVSMGVYIRDDGRLYANTTLGEDEITSALKKIKYCPMCGSKIQKEGKNG